MDMGSSGKTEQAEKLPEREEKLLRKQDPTQKHLQEGQSHVAGQKGESSSKPADAPLVSEAHEQHHKKHGKHHGAHRGEKQPEEHHGEHHHKPMTPMEDEFTYHGELGDIETMTEDPDWRRENMPSVPLEKKDPKHHDVVEEGIIPEAHFPDMASDEKTAA